MARIGFAIATITKPQILIADEGAGGGRLFVPAEVRKADAGANGGGTTVILVSHSIEQIERMCSKVAWLSHGRLKMNGDTKTVCDAYKAVQRAGRRKRPIEGKGGNGHEPASQTDAGAVPLRGRGGPGGRPARVAKRTAGFVRRRFFGKKARVSARQKGAGSPARAVRRHDPGELRPARHQHLTPLYNTPPPTWRAFLDSFVGQTAPNGQLCLADASDAEHPEVGQIAREYQAKYQQIVYKKVENRGIAANTNAAAALADGEYLALADHDDVLAPHAMAAMGQPSWTCGPRASGRLSLQRRGPV